MTPSPNYGRRRANKNTRKARNIYLVGIERHAGQVLVTVAGSRQPPVSFYADDDSDAMTMVQLLKAGAFSLPINPLPLQRIS